MTVLVAAAVVVWVVGGSLVLAFVVSASREALSILDVLAPVFDPVAEAETILRGDS